MATFLSRPVIQAPRTSYGAPRRIQQTDSVKGPQAGSQRATPEGYKVNRNSQYNDKDAGIRSDLGPALPVGINPMYDRE